ncbi:hypothetical protein OPT61_g9007 [Boeremia exigua]|uniref:Uncharacterized protein n=1 Tax=Boeremia exigua TaxID=749465 RepID=A0ACC2HWC0_9PLEO|nr:hypothetical protein OPT61_g9007 [Boeremia exigua]
MEQPVGRTTTCNVFSGALQRDVIGRVTAVCVACSPDFSCTQVSICEADISAKLIARDFVGPSVLHCARFPITEATVVVGPFDGALRGGDRGKDANSSNDCRDNGIGMHGGGESETDKSPKGLSTSTAPNKLSTAVIGLGKRNLGHWAK